MILDYTIYLNKNRFAIVCNYLLGIPDKGELSPQDYEHLKKKREFVLGISELVSAVLEIPRRLSLWVCLNNTQLDSKLNTLTVSQCVCFQMALEPYFRVVNDRMASRRMSDEC